MFQPTQIKRHDNFWVVRDDLIVGGTKTRALSKLFESSNHSKVAYACDLY